MTIVSRRLVPFAAVLAVALTLAVWITASAGGWPQGSSPLPPMHLKTIPTSKHISLNGATDQNPTGATIQKTANVLASGKQVGRAFIACTFVDKVVAGLCNVELRFPDKGRLELQGGVTGSAAKTFAIVGGTGAYATARGWVVVDHHHVTITFR
jgi:hypothetical protein